MGNVEVTDAELIGMIGNLYIRNQKLMEYNKALEDKVRELLAQLGQHEEMAKLKENKAG